MNTATLNAPTTHQAGAPAGPRFDMYQPIHKGLRAFMSDTLGRVGRVDVFDAEDMARTLAQFEALLNFCLKHLAHENEFLHAAIAARVPGGAGRTVDDHVEHIHSIEALRAEGRNLLAAPDDERMALALRLYRHLALFVAENLQHMHIEETANNAMLWAHYSDAELVEIHDRLLATIDPVENMEVMRWMVPALSPVQRAGLLSEIKTHAPAPVFDAVIDAVRPHLDVRDWLKLARAVGVPQQAGLVNYA
ncbi:MAG TPA: hypothetical protein VFL64_05445 [Rhizobacter sp.]|nr:hypothetical protein [Rhizobacter sp.]